MRKIKVGNWTVTPSLDQLECDGRSIDIEPQAMDVLVYLAEHAGDVVSADELISAAWQSRVVGDSSVYERIRQLRKAFGDDFHEPKFIQTLPKRGYRLIAPVHVWPPDVPSLISLQRLIPQRWQQAAILLCVFSLVTVIGYLVSLESPPHPSDQREKPSIAVLPFVNMSPNPEQEYFSDGLSEEIRTLLARNPGLKVIGRSSSFAFKGKNEDLRIIGEMLGVKTVLEGSVRKSGDQVRITAQLIDVSDGSHIWSESYDRTITDIFGVQDDVATAIIDALQVHVATNPTRERPTPNWQAYIHYLEARASMHSDMRHAEEKLLLATELDPSFADAWESLAFVYFRQAGSIIEAEAGQKLVGHAAARALAVDPDLVLARAMFEVGNVDSWSWTREIAALERALLVQPDSLELLHALRYDLFQAGYHQEALVIAERMINLDPLAESAIDALTNSLYAVRRTDETIALLESAIRLGFNQAKWDLGEIYLVEGQDDVAFSYFEEHERYTGYSDPTWVQDWVARAREPVTGQGFLDRSLEEEIAALPEEYAYSWRLGSAEWYLYLGYLDRYFELIFSASPTASHWTDAERLVSAGMMFRRQGFSAHPKYLDVAEDMGIIELWEERGPPDFCDKVGGQWICE